MAIYRTLKIYSKDREFHLEFDRNEYLRKQIEGKKILHVGCSDFPITQQRIKEKTLLHMLLQSSAKEIVGIDISDEGINILKENGVENAERPTGYRTRNESTTPNMYR